ncbi:MAG: NADH:ubiquinone oxidoreductase [Thermodesulfobacteriota bacterium]
MKPKIGIFSFTSCEGCQLQILNLEQEFVDLCQYIEIVNFREAMTEKGDDYEIAFIEGSITRTSEIEMLKNIRENAKVLVALGACSDLGGVNVLKNLHEQKSWLPSVYGRKDIFPDTIPTKRTKDVVSVDLVIPGCPIDKEEFLRVVKSLLIGIEPRLPNYPVCVECRSKGNVCLFEKKGWCLGPITRAGCKAICPTYRDSCVGCRGLVDEPNIESLTTILRDSGLSDMDIQREFTIFNGLERIVL